ncbi:cytochrome c3 family protein [Bacillus sp. T33-2]|uniref:cytochrome c3 family protein n=1 Tax=Bacillus sp. T33-2 TaxID=2054168 RepID=UPI000C782F31|nr:cytochrome c3 family protein [Bacillus sp. T33-2]PLR91917.1 hypothetical protein CVD19_21230 [Bacillus sp. T33-2]
MKKTIKHSLISYCAAFTVFLGSALFPFPDNFALSNTDSTITATTESETTTPSPTPEEQGSTATVPTEVAPAESYTDTVPTEPDPVPASEPEPGQDAPSQTESFQTMAEPVGDTQRPIVTDIKIIPPATIDPNPWPVEDMARVPLESKIQVTIEDNSASLDNFGLIVTSQDGENVVDTPESTISEPGKFTSTFSLTSLSSSKTYYVYINPFLTDSDGNRVFPTFIKFSTAGDTKNPTENPHGSYMTNTNTCANCHSTHVADKGKLEGGKFSYKDGVRVQNYCIACHDGTLGINQPDNWNKEHTHFDYDSEVSSCSNCHNPHLDWTTKNPNLLKDHYVYDHDQSLKPEAAGVGVQDSNNILCESCHDNNTVFVKNADTNKVNHYDKKLWTELSLDENEPLCFTCHNIEKEIEDPRFKDIQKYYNQTTDSGHYFTAGDITQTAGYLPCADCHETHGSNNLKMLRENPGNKPPSDPDKYQTAGSEWNASNERTFCLKCHNGTTDLYQRSPALPEKDGADQPITGHPTGDQQACSSCHSSEPAGSDFIKQSMGASHAPKRLKPAP